MNKLLKKRYFFPLAGWDVVRAFIALLMSRNLTHNSISPVSVPEDFFGINVATSEDEDCDEFVLARLEELKINNVRLAFSYCSFEGAADRFLNKLLNKGFIVTLVLLPSYVAAKNMLICDATQKEWRSFLARVFENYANRVSVFEIGSTPNRKKWSGFQLRSYLQAKQIACEEAANYDIRLAGPNIQDFEPYANVALLSAMRRICSVPVVHTNNLFVERVIEPEAYDHRALGSWATHLFKLNLTKKAKILKFLGERAGCSVLYSTCSFWSTKRLSRWSAWPQRKKVDYLARYLVAAATSGALDRVYWGPLICGRDGLIECKTEYPEIDNSTFYQRVRGDVDQLVVTSAFSALGYVSQRLRNARCDDAVNAQTGVNHFSFVSSDDEIFHVCWCRDGQAIRLDDLYSDEQLSAAEFTDACGCSIVNPVVINERVLFVDFPLAKKQVKPAASAPSTYMYRDPDVVYLSTPFMQAVPWRDQDWRGAFSVTNTASSLTLGDRLKPEAMVALPELEVLRDGRNRLWNIEHPLDSDQQLTVKLNRPTGIKRLSYYFKPSKGLRHWNNASIMLLRGIGTPAPIAFYERHDNSGVRQSYYVCEYIAEAFSSRHVCAAVQRGNDDFKGLTRRQWLDVLSSFICRMHNSGIVHRDLSVGNLMFQQQTDGTITPYLIDIGRARITSKGAEGRHRLLDLMRICYKLDWPNRNLFVQSYNRHWGRSLPSYWRLALGYYDLKQGTKKNLKARFRRGK